MMVWEKVVGLLLIGCHFSGFSAMPTLGVMGWTKMDLDLQLQVHISS